MALNTTPVFTGTPHTAYISTGVNANTALDGTGTVATVYTAGANGSIVQAITCLCMGTSVATVLRLFINNGSTNVTASNNALVAEIAIPANTLSQTAASIPQVIAPNIILPAGYKINCTIGTAIAAGIMVCAQGGDF
jgi:hypothetical protein